MSGLDLGHGDLSTWCVSLESVGSLQPLQIADLRQRAMAESRGVFWSCKASWEAGGGERLGVHHAITCTMVRYTGGTMNISRQFEYLGKC